MSEPRLTALPEADSTNLYCKAHLSRMGHFDAVWTTCQTAGRGRRGHVWQNAPGAALYYTILFKEPLADPACLPLASGLAAARALEECFGVECALKWPNDLLLGGKKIAVMDFGIKENMVRELHGRGHTMTLYPAWTTAEEILADKPDGILLSNGPGDPKDNPDIIANIKKLIGKKPIMGICMGHQLLALANGMDSYKLKYGHRGANQPVKDLETGRVYISSQNHGYVIREPEAGSGIEVTFRNVNDGTIEGLSYKDHPSFSVQFHPEACPGPMDTQFLFDKFERMMEGKTNAKK